MRQFIKNILIILLCLVITFPVSLSFLLYYQQLRAIKKEVKQELIANTPKSDLVIFSFLMQDEDFQNLRWHDGHEFEWNNKMFDLVAADTLGSMVYYTCFPDKQETALNAKFKIQLQDRYTKDRGKKNKSVQICAMFLSLFSQNHSTELPSLTYTFSNTLHISKTTYTEPFLQNLGPPPEFRL